MPPPEEIHGDAEPDVAGMDPDPPPGSRVMRSESAGLAERTDRPGRFAALVEPEIEAMLRVALRLTGSPGEAEDVVQDSLIRAYGALDRFDGRHPRAWLFTIVRRAHLNSLRRTRPAPAEHHDLERAAPAFGADRAPSPEDLVDAQLLDADVEAALAALDPRSCQVVLLVDVDRLTAAETAEALGIPVGTVVSRLSRARSRLRRHLSHRRPGEGEPR